MSINAIRARLVTDLGAITGVTKVFHDEPDIFPSPPDMPCFILSMRDPMVTATGDTNSSIAYTWHFDLTFIFKPAELGNVAENMSALEDFIKLTVDKMSANITGGGTWQNWNKDSDTLDFSGGILTRPNAPENQGRVWGWTCALDITESVTTTMSAGT